MKVLESRASIIEHCDSYSIVVGHYSCGKKLCIAIINRLLVTDPIMKTRIVLFCLVGVTGFAPVFAQSSDENAEKKLSLIERRILMERRNRDNPFVLIPHRTTYILPFAYSPSPNTDLYAASGVELKNMEIKGQISVKLQLLRNVFSKHAFLYAAYTQLVHWQAFNTKASSPFRNSNHEPELFLTFLTDSHIAGMHQRIVSFGINHQSNGRSLPFSRSWNRLFMEVIMERGPFYLSIKPWWRFPEKAKTDPTDAIGDDNPDIDDYLGYGELLGVVEAGPNRFSVKLRNNLRSQNKGAVELGWTIPFRPNMRAYVQYFNGYGENLLDYNASVQRFSVGVMLIDWL